jgi:hypothetical protein
MLLVLGFLAAPPPAFVQAIDQRIAGTHLQLVDWWSDDLDGDKVAESIAEVCDDSTGMYLVQHGTKLLEVPREIDGRNHCDVAAQRPEWGERHLGVIEEQVSVHHGSDMYRLAIRGGAAVMVQMESDGFDVVRGGQDGQEEYENYETLTWKRVHTPPKRPATRTSGPLVLAGRSPGRAVTLFGATTVTASAANVAGPIVLHIHADRALTLNDCSGDDGCAAKKIAKGDTDLEVGNVEVKIVAGKQRRELHVVTLDADSSYPPPPTPW